MEYDLARARNVEAAPVAMYWTARTRSFLPRPVHYDRLFHLPVRSLRRSYSTVAYGMVRRHSIHRPSICPSLKGKRALS
eukprot:scaffold40627_cov77-Attheya_sp.AAC.1